MVTLASNHVKRSWAVIPCELINQNILIARRKDKETTQIAIQTEATSIVQAVQCKLRYFFNCHLLQDLILLSLNFAFFGIGIQHKITLKMKYFHYFVVLLLVINHCIGSNNGIQRNEYTDLTEKTDEYGKILTMKV